jgi:hypothetical protein
VQVDVEPLYAAFADQPRPTAIEACPHCRDPADFEDLLVLPLREIDDDLLGRFLSHPGTVGSAADRQWLAPRAIELVVSGQCRYAGIEPTLHAFVHAGWESWPAVQRAAVVDVLGTFWTQTLAACPAPYPADDVLSGLSLLVPTVEPYLADWDLTSAPAVSHLRDLVAANAGTVIAKNRLTSPYWSPAAGEPVIAWLRSPRLAAAVTSAVVAATDPVTVDALDEVDRYLVAFG